MSCPGLCLLNHMCQGSPWGAVLSLSILLALAQPLFLVSVDLSLCHSVLILILAQ